MRSFIFILVFAFSALSFGQNADEKALNKSYQNYFSFPHEAVHLHLNKTTFLTGEEIWWSGYIYDKKSGKPSERTSNLYCGIFDENGNELQKELFYVQKGRTKGNFPVSRKLKSGTYYIKAGTSWMKNFEEDKDFIQKITIINQEISQKTVADADAYDLQLLPEGGHLITNADNSIGVRLVDQSGKGIKIAQGKVLDANNNVIKSFTTNYYGVGKFDLFIDKETAYTVQMTLDNGKLINTVLQKPKDKGIVISVNNILDDKLIIALKTNEETLKEIENQKFYLAIHRDGLMTLNNFSFNETKKNINIDRRDLRPGTNIITVFNEDLQPVLERLIFNHDNLNIAETKIAKTKKIKDSIEFQINVFSKTKSKASLSVTALPEETIANNPKSNIISSFLLEPYLSSAIENPGYYFNDSDRKKKFELDLVLLTHGWSSYNWNTIFKEIPESFEYPFEQGISFNGKIVDSKIREGDQVAVHTGDFSSLFYTELRNAVSFNIDNIFIENGDKINVALRNKKGRFRKPNFKVNTQKSILNTKERIPQNLIDAATIAINLPKNLSVEQNNTNFKGFVTPDLTQLDAVVVSEKKKEEEFTRNPQLLKLASYEGFKINEDDFKTSQLLTDFLRTKGFQITIVGGQITVRTPRTIGSTERVGIYINNFLINDNSELFNVRLNEIDEIYINRSGVGEDRNAGAGAIRIFRKTGAASEIRINPNFAEQLVANSFSKAKKFYRPKYNSFLSKDFKEYGVIHWEPNLLTDAQGRVTFKLPDNGVKNVTFFIEGISEDGKLTSTVKNIGLE